MEKVMVEFFRALIATFSKPQNAGMTFALVCLYAIGTLYIKQSGDHTDERQAWRVELAKKDSILNAQRQDFMTTTKELQRDIADCLKAQERQESRIEQQRAEIMRLRTIVEKKR